MLNLRHIGLLVPLLAAGVLAHAGPMEATGPMPPGETVQEAQKFDHTHAQWTEILKGSLDGGLVNYAALRKSPKALDAYLGQLEGTTPAQHATWTRNQRYAFWINAYNAYTIQLIRDKGPVKSIKKLGGFLSSPWEKKFIDLRAFDPEKDDDKLMLDEIEHDILRPVFKDARVHAAINCASMSCPPLRKEAFQASKLDEQLDDQVQVWLGDITRNELVPKKGKIYVSKIFNWFEDDFGGKDERVIEWIANHVKDEALGKRLKAEAKTLDVKYLDYDWSINAKKENR